MERIIIFQFQGMAVKLCCYFFELIVLFTHLEKGDILECLMLVTIEKTEINKLAHF